MIIVVSLGTVAAALLAATTIALLAPLNETGTLSVAWGSFLVYFPFCLAGEVLIGVPIFFLLLRARLVHWWIWLPASIALGVAIGFLMGGVPARDILTFITSISVAFVSAVTFRLVAMVVSRRSSKSRDGNDTTMTGD
jgi:hypothetical protein